MKNVWIIVPVKSGDKVYDFIFSELIWASKVVNSSKKINLQIVVVADENSKFKFKKFKLKVISNNGKVGEKINEGFSYAFSNGADAVVLSNSYTWIHPSFFLKSNFRKMHGYHALFSTQKGIIDNNGSEYLVSLSRKPNPTPMNFCICAYTREVMEKFSFRPCDESSDFFNNEEIFKIISKSFGKNKYRILKNDVIFEQIILFRDISDLGMEKSFPIKKFSNPWRRIKKIYPERFISEAKSFYESVRFSNSSSELVNIRRGYVSPSLYATFGEEFLSKFNLIDGIKYPDYNLPAVFFGCYKERDILNIQKNKSDLKVLIYGGTDATRKKNLLKLKKEKNLYHVAISNFISDDLNNVGIKHKRLNVVPVDHSRYDINPVPLGDSIYIYMNSKHKAEQYGEKLYTQAMDRFPDINFIVCGAKSNTRGELIDIYKKCFMGLRLIDHDGLSNTVVEMGLMGRKTVHNGSVPACLRYRNIDDIFNHIEIERRKIGSVQTEVSEATKRYVTLPKGWLDRSFWKA